MRAAVLHAPSDLRVDEVPRPRPEAGEVLVQVRACGICGSDLPRILTTGTYRFPTIPGHELAGEVVELGQGLDERWLGARVAVVPLLPCRRCAMCGVGEYAMCSDYNFLGSRCDGGFAEYVRTPASSLIRLPDQVSYEQGAMLEPLTVALHAIQNCGVGYGDTVLVFGLGPVGNLLAQWALALGAGRVLGVEQNDWKRELAAARGVEVISGSDGPLAEQLLEVVGGAAVNVAFEASGFSGALPAIMPVMAPMGTIGLVGRPAHEISLAPEYFERQLRQQVSVRGNWSFQFTDFPHHAWTTAAEAVARGDISLDPLITHRVGLADLFGTVQAMATGGADVMKALVLPQQ
ncbi:MAG: galactitol-1-phosphate 5-dehydrogenase [Propionicimonas sp.]